MRSPSRGSLPVVAALLERRPAILALRRALPASVAKLLTARSPTHLAALLSRNILEAIILGPESVRGVVLQSLRRDFPGVPLLLYAPLRSDDADLVLRAHRDRVAALALEGLDEPVLGRLVRRHGLTARRQEELIPLGPRLGLLEPLQQRAWVEVVTGAPGGLTTAVLARRLKVRRETLSRSFAAGGAPSLKRAIDAVRLVAAGQLLGNPGYRVADVAQLLGFSSVSLLQRTARRTFGVSARGLALLDGSHLAAALQGDGPPAGWA
ncbi:MAG: helix-turn-helix domain-containing protein [Gemmatimonadota bacterium]